MVRTTGETATPRYLVLDGIRGFAALVVLWFHASGFAFFPKGYLAVDLFFLLSGFVIANAYEWKLQAGGGFPWFFGVRLARLYPTYLAGLIAGALVSMSGDRDMPLAFLGGLFGVPFMTGIEREAYVINGVFWSLVVEMVVGLAYALCGFNRRTRSLAMFAAAMLLGYIAIRQIPHDTEAARALVEWVSGYARGFFSFSLGVIFWRLKQADLLPHVRIPAPVLLACMIILFAIPARVRITDIPTLFIGLPVLFLGLLNLSPPRGLVAKVCEWSGKLSYPLYAIQLPAMMALWPAFESKALPFVATATIVTVILAYALHRTVERHGRTFIERISPRPARQFGGATRTATGV